MPIPSWLNPGVVTLVGAILVALGTFWGFYRQTARSEEIARLNRELAAKSDEIATLTKENLATITGGDSFCYVSLASPRRPAGTIAVLVPREVPCV
jgi:hypothetical protein